MTDVILATAAACSTFAGVDQGYAATRDAIVRHAEAPLDELQPARK